MPGLHSHSPAIDYLNILSEISGFIDSCRCDVNIIVGDFNVDFDRRGLLCDLLTTFMSDMNLTACDLFFRQEIKYTYERDDTMARSWIDHVLCTQSFSSSLSDMYTIKAGSNLSDHFPLCFLLHTKCLAPPYSPQSSPSPASRYIIWSPRMLNCIKSLFATISPLSHLKFSAVPIPNVSAIKLWTDMLKI